jgi:hypothetical protein
MFVGAKRPEVRRPSAAFTGSASAMRDQLIPKTEIRITDCTDVKRVLFAARFQFGNRIQRKGIARHKPQSKEHGPQSGTGVSPVCFGNRRHLCWNTQARRLCHSIAGIVTNREDFSRQRPPAGVAQVSKPAVSPTSKSAERPPSCHLRVWKPATQQTWKSALLGLRLRRAVPLR